MVVKQVASLATYACHPAFYCCSRCFERVLLLAELFCWVECPSRAGLLCPLATAATMCDRDWLMCERVGTRGGGVISLPLYMVYCRACSVLILWG